MNFRIAGQLPRRLFVLRFTQMPTLRQRGTGSASVEGYVFQRGSVLATNSEDLAVGWDLIE